MHLQLFWMGPDVRRRGLSVATFCFQRYQSKATHRRHLQLHSPSPVTAVDRHYRPWWNPFNCRSSYDWLLWLQYVAMWHLITNGGRWRVAARAIHWWPWPFDCGDCKSIVESGDNAYSKLWQSIRRNNSDLRGFVTTVIVKAGYTFTTVANRMPLFLLLTRVIHCRYKVKLLVLLGQE